ncbi:endonuclease/exonuclease/phosphatase family protein [Aliivibrio finisterrensis]|uniref:endonuclease/exonuclease/phosphatase family protein n=1 Tax=Aliivibrio finisterrensis TaxID=511998 RepID=UPI001F5D0D22|nr:endonuclease/exonuclease/phosphatase family protein [Aliivibrio finisterrensis]
MNQRITHLFSFFILVFSSFSSYAITISTWNMEWLTLNSNEKFQSSKRHLQDFEQLNHYFSLSNSQVLAFQEVDSIEAIQKVVGNDYQIFISDRSTNPKKQFNDINQYTGFAIHSSIPATNPKDFTLLPNKKSSKLRYATYIIATINEQPIHLLSVHLKSGCLGQKKNNYSCSTLEQQTEELTDWINEREDKNEKYLILGDFNHTLAHPRSWLWRNIDKQANKNPILLTKNTKGNCTAKQWKRGWPKYTTFTRLIDHGISNIATNNLTVTQQVFKQSDVKKYQLTDHCPILFTYQ